MATASLISNTRKGTWPSSRRLSASKNIALSKCANPGERNPCPIEYRNIFIKEIEPSESPEPGEPRKLNASLAKLLARIDAGELPEGYVPAKHQEYVDRRWSELSPGQSARVNQLWKEKQAVDPDMPNRGFSFVKILAYVADEEGRVDSLPRCKS